MSDWMPEVGKRCLAQVYPNGRSPVEWQECEVLKLNHNGLHAVLVDSTLYWCATLKPIQTEAGKYRDEQIEKIGSLTNCGGRDPLILIVADAESAYEQGVRVLADNEFIGRDMTNEQIDALISDYKSYNKQGFLTDDTESIINAVLSIIKS